MTQEAQTLGLELKGVYSDELSRRGFKQQSEAFALGVDQSSVSNYRNPDSEKNLPLALAAKSLVGDTLAAWLAEQRDGFFVKACLHLDGSTCNERCDILTALGKMQQAIESGDVNAEQKLWRKIQHSATAAIEEGAK